MRRRVDRLYEDCAREYRALRNGDKDTTHKGEKVTRGRPSAPNGHAGGHYTEAEHRAIIEYLATEPPGSKQSIWDNFQKTVRLLLYYVVPTNASHTLPTH